MNVLSNRAKIDLPTRHGASSSGINMISILLREYSVLLLLGYVYAQLERDKRKEVARLRSIQGNNNIGDFHTLVSVHCLGFGNQHEGIIIQGSPVQGTFFMF